MYNLKGYALEYVNYLNKAVILKKRMRKFYMF